MLFLREIFILAAFVPLPTTIFRAIEPSLPLVYLQPLVPFLPCLSGLLLRPAAGSNKFLRNVVTSPTKCAVPRSQMTVICIATTWRTSNLTFCFSV
jgi:hypothetical protein